MGYLDKRIGRKSRVEKFSELAQGKDKKETRQLERKFLKPEPIKDHVGPKATAKGLEKWTVKLVFQNQEDFELFTKYFKVSKYVNPSVVPSHLKMLFDLMRGLESGAIAYDKKEGTFSVGKRTRLRRRNL